MALTATEGAAVALLVTADELLIDDCARIAAACGVDLFVAATMADALAKWGSTGLILIGEDRLAAVTASGLARRPGVVVVLHDPDGPDNVSTWRQSVAIGAEHVVELPVAEDWLITRISELSDGAAAGGPVISVVAARGGAGASSLACALALRAPRDVLLVDADALGGGLDLRLEADEVPGLRWTDLAATRGRVSPSALRAALPSLGQVSMAVPSRGSPSSLTTDPVASVIDAGSRGYSLTIIDCPRADTDLARLIWSRSSTALVVVPNDIHGVVCGTAVTELAASAAPSVQVVVRRHRHGSLDPTEVEDAIGFPVAGVLADEQAIARGELVAAIRGSSVRRSCEAVLVSCGVGDRRRARRSAS